MQNKGEAKIGTIIVIGLIIGLIAYVGNFGGFADTVNSWGGSDSETSEDGLSDTSTKDCPTTGVTTYTVNVQDELTASATNVDAEYFIFNGNKLIKEGTTGSDGTVDVDVTCGKDYKMLLLNTTAGSGQGAYSKIVDLNARISADTMNVELVKFGEAKILGIENPADPSRLANVTLTAGATKNFELKMVANATEKGYNRPIVMCQVNISSISTVDIGSFSDGTQVLDVTSLPKRVSASAGYAYYAWEYPKMLTPAVGVITASGNIVALASVTPSIVDSMSCIIVDQATWKNSGYKTSSSIEAGFITGPENTETLADIGGPDATASTYTYVHAGGY